VKDPREFAEQQIYKLCGYLEPTSFLLSLSGVISCLVFIGASKSLSLFLRIQGFLQI
jgi:hypothetical protein